MALYAGIMTFLSDVTHLTSFPLFCAYLLMIMLSGFYQKNTKPFTLRQPMVVYNFVCTALSIYTFAGFCYGLLLSPHIYHKQKTPILEHVFTVYWYSKITELLDTFFMVLRHKRRQISFLHVYHHSSMVVLSDYARLYAAWPAIAPILGLNSMVHIVLYLYYGLTALNPENPPQWKQRLTEFQILQFFLDLIFAAIGYLYHGFCIYGIMYGMGMIYLFGSFYYQAYVRPKPVKPKTS